LLRAKGELISSVSTGVVLPDPTDSKFLSCAQAADAIVVTGNLKHFPKERCRGIEIVNAAQLMGRMTFEI